ncbi:MAG: SEC-C domain-containing protein [Verrucomicrobia bacterium]|nr:SEC-C domain-containing protein [Verrucomicrobiota bacterium]
MSEKQKRNELCPCGSQKKYKKCCGMQKAVQKQKAFSRMIGPTGAAPFVQGLTQRVFKVLGDGSQVKQPKDLEGLKKM